MSAVSKTSIAMQVFTTPKFKEHLLSFMDIDALLRLSLVAKKIPSAAIDKILKKRVLEAIPEEHIWKRIGKDNALCGVEIGHFFTRIERSLSDYPVPMAGFEQTAPGIFHLYQIDQLQVIGKPRLPCLPDWVQHDELLLESSEGRLIREKGPMCCEYRGIENEGCWEGIRFVGLMCIGCCCFSSRTTIYGWLKAFGENGGGHLIRVQSQDVEKSDSKSNKTN